MPEPAPRPSARVLLVDAGDRLLLMRWVDPRLDVPAIWITPGGGVREGEAWEDAARRELREEVGLADVALGPCVWERRASVTFDGGTLTSLERFYLARVEAPEVDTSKMEAEEAAYLDRVHWWSIEELAAARDELFAPREIAALAAPLLAGRVPAQPIAIGL